MEKKTNCDINPSFTDHMVPTTHHCMFKPNYESKLQSHANNDMDTFTQSPGHPQPCYQFIRGITRAIFANSTQS